MFAIPVTLPNGVIYDQPIGLFIGNEFVAGSAERIETTILTPAAGFARSRLRPLMTLTGWSRSLRRRFRAGKRYPELSVDGCSISWRI
jgi:hypothetical protein